MLGSASALGVDVYSSLPADFSLRELARHARGSWCICWDQQGSSVSMGQWGQGCHHRRTGPIVYFVYQGSRRRGGLLMAGPQGCTSPPTVVENLGASAIEYANVNAYGAMSMRSTRGPPLTSPSCPCDRSQGSELSCSGKPDAQVLLVLRMEVGGLADAAGRNASRHSRSGVAMSNHARGRKDI